MSPSTRPEPLARPAPTVAWTAGKLLLFAGFIALAIASYLAFNPITNPNVQDCGSPLAFFLTDRENVVVRLGDPAAPPNAGELAAQPTCRERAGLELQQAGLAAGAFLGLTIVGVLVGLVDDRIAYWRAPRFESLLRPMDSELRIRHGLVPRVDVDELGVELPPLETPEVWGLAVFGVLTCIGLPVAATLDATRAAAGEARLVPLLAAILITVATFGAAAVQRKAVYPADEPWTRTLEIVVAAAWLGTLRPLVGAFGIDVHHLRKSGLRRSDAVVDVQVMQTISVTIHAGLLIIATLLVLAMPLPEVSFAIPQYALAALLGLFLLSGFSRLGNRLRGLPVRPGTAGIKGIDRVAPTPEQRAMLLGGTFGITVLNVIVLALALGAFGVTLSTARLLFVYLAAVVVGAFGPTPNGVGVFEAAMALLLIRLGVDPGAAVCATLAFRAMTFWFPLIPGQHAARRMRAEQAL